METADRGPFRSISIFDAIGRIGSQQKPLYLPAIQRHFVWGRKRICDLFDSMMRGYPIGTFLFWEVEDENRNDYTFYEFIRDYSEHSEDRNNCLAPPGLPTGVTGVLDGQQRLNSMYVALQGSYAAYSGGTGCPRSHRAYYQKRCLFLNVHFVPEDDDDVKYRFEFRRMEDAEPKSFDDGHCWFAVHRVFHCASVSEVDKEWDKFRAGFLPNYSISPEKSESAVEILRLLWRKIREEKLITYFPVVGRDLSEALKIFIRANNGGVSVTNAEMIFSTIIAHWESGREKIEDFVSELNAVGNRFEFDVSSLMLACLALSGSPVRLKIESFKPVHVENIKLRWAEIAEHLRQAVHLFDQWGFSGNNAVNVNAIIAVALFLQRNVSVKKSGSELRLFVIKALVCEVFRRAERTLAVIRDYADGHVVANGEFHCAHFEAEFELPSGQRMDVTIDRLNELLDLPIWDRRTFVVLSLLHGHHALHQHAFHKDHIHPHSRFRDLTTFSLSPEKVSWWHHWKDRLPNLQLLQDISNMGKKDTPFVEWIARHQPDLASRAIYLNQNDIDESWGLEFEDFEGFVAKRRKRLRKRLASLLNVELPPEELGAEGTETGVQE